MFCSILPCNVRVHCLPLSCYTVSKYTYINVIFLVIIRPLIWGINTYTVRIQTRDNKSIFKWCIAMQQSFVSPRKQLACTFWAQLVLQLFFLILLIHAEVIKYIEVKLVKTMAQNHHLNIIPRWITSDNLNWSIQPASVVAPSCMPRDFCCLAVPVQFLLIWFVAELLKRVWRELGTEPSMTPEMWQSMAVARIQQSLQLLLWLECDPVRPLLPVWLFPAARSVFGSYGWLDKTND